MGHTYACCLTHIVFSTKNRIPYLREEKRHDVFAYLGGIARETGLTALNIGGYEDHAHLLLAIPASICVADAVRILKTNSSRWVHDKQILHPAFAWQEGYGAFSVSESCREAVARYIDTQAEHHRRVSFQDEFLMFLRLHKIPYDERYIWT